MIYGDNDNFVICVKRTCAPPVMRCRYTSGESPTDSRVRPSGDSDAKSEITEFASHQC